VFALVAGDTPDPIRKIPRALGPQIHALPTQFLPNLMRILNKSIRNQNLGLILLRLSARQGVSYLLAICGGTVKDLIGGFQPYDIDVSVGGNYDELIPCLQDTGNYSSGAKKHGQFKFRRLVQTLSHYWSSPRLHWLFVVLEWTCSGCGSVQSPVKWQQWEVRVYLRGRFIYGSKF